MKFLFFIFFFGTLQAQETEIIKKLINYSQERVELSRAYLKEHYEIEQKTSTIVPRMIVLHYTAGGTVQSNFDYFNRLEIENTRNTLKKQSTLNVSAQFIIDRDGKIYQLMEPNQFARHTIGLNYCAIGIENIGSKRQPLTEKQVTSNADLIKYLKKKYDIEYLIGHSEYGRFRKSSLWKETNLAYYTEKEDPGAEFMRKVRALVFELKLKDRP